MRINIWVPREHLIRLDKFLKSTHDGTTDEILTFYHDKPVQRIDLVQVNITVDEYQMIVDSKEQLEQDIAKSLGWVKTSTNDLDTDNQLRMLFGD